jgi:hypothetical protein
LIFSEGGNAMFVIALGLLKLQQRELLKVSDEALLLGMLRDIPKNLFSAEPLISLSFAKFGSLITSKTIANLRKRIEPQILQQVAETNEKRKQATLRRVVRLADFVETPDAPVSTPVPTTTTVGSPSDDVPGIFPCSPRTWFRISEQSPNRVPDSPNRLTIGRRTE